jgi:ADP-glucose pyrophosphorylase
VCDYPLKEMLEFHRARDAEATILVTKVDDPSKYGVIILDEYGRVQQFVEKPKVRGLFCWGFHQGIEFGSCLTPTISPKERCCLGVM